MRDNGTNDPTQSSQSPFGVYDLLAVLRKRWPIMLAIFIAVSAVGIYRTMQKTHMYRAAAKISFNFRSDSTQIAFNPQGLVRLKNVDEAWFRRQMEVIRGEQIARRVAESLNMIKDPKNENQVNAAVGLIRGSMNLEYVEITDSVVIYGISSNPDLTYKIANAAAEAYLRHNQDAKYSNYRKSIQDFKEQLADLETKLDQDQQNLIDFIKRENITSYGENYSRGVMPPMVTESGEIETRRFLENLNSQKVEAEIELGKLKDKYLDEHPKIQKVLNSIAVLNKKIDQEAQRLEALNKIREGEIIKAKEKEIQYSILKRKVEVNKQLYDILIKKLQETDVGAEISLSANDVEITEYAKRPSMPYWPNKRREAMFTFLVALLVSLGVGVVIQYLDSSYKSVEDIKADLNYPVLSSIPFFKPRGKGQILLLDKEEDESNLKEAFRLLRTNLRFALAERPGKQIIITSTQKGEGKSTVAVNLGLTMAEAGTRTLVVDSDVRVRSLKNLFGVKTAKGLSDYLSGNAHLGEIVMATHVPGLSFVPSGPIVKNPSLLFESDHMKRFIKEAGEGFDFVIFDAPPVGYVVDASLFCSLVDGVVMIVEAERVAKKAAKDAVEALLKGKANIYGIIFNKEAYSTKRYYYKYYRYYGDSKDKHA